jgi:hypothetical protein
VHPETRSKTVSESSLENSATGVHRLFLRVQDRAERSLVLGLAGSITMTLVLVLPPLLIGYVLAGNLVGTYLLMIGAPVTGLAAWILGATAMVAAFRSRAGRKDAIGGTLGVLAVFLPFAALALT